MRLDSSNASKDEPVSLRLRSALVQVLLAASILLDLSTAGLIFVEVALLGEVIGGRSTDIEALQVNNDRIITLGTVGIVGLVVTAVAWWVWQYRAQANLVSVGRRSLDHGPWGAVGWWLVPVANLWMPFKTMRELWKASEPVEDPGAWTGLATWPVLGWWWALWILGNILQSASGFANDSEDLEAIRTADVTALAGLSCSVFAACLAIGVVRHISERQAALAAVVGLPSVAAARPDTHVQPLVPRRPDVG
jgi:hypothetical protein